MLEGYLAKGDPQPPRIEGKLRLYSAGLSPYALRVRLVLIAKGIPYDIVNINLQLKPNWLAELNPKGKIPILDTGSQVISESLDISDYLDEKYPNPPLYPQDEKQKTADKELILSCEETLPNLLFAVLFNNEHKKLSEHMKVVKPHLEKLEHELENRGKYFGGESPKMVDYMLWPLAEKAGLIDLAYNEKPLPDKAFPRLKQWCKAMHTQEPVKETFISIEEQYKFLTALKILPTR